MKFWSESGLTGLIERMTGYMHSSGTHAGVKRSFFNAMWPCHLFLFGYCSRIDRCIADVTDSGANCSFRFDCALRLFKKSPFAAQVVMNLFLGSDMMYSDLKGGE